MKNGRRKTWSGGTIPYQARIPARTTSPITKSTRPESTGATGGGALGGEGRVGDGAHDPLRELAVPGRSVLSSPCDGGRATPPDRGAEPARGRPRSSPRGGRRL